MRPLLRIFAIAGFFLTVIIVPASAQTLAVVGTTVRSIVVDGQRYILADILMFEGAIGGSGRTLMTLNAGITWGVKGGFSADPYFGNALRRYLVPGVSVFAQGRFGTLVLNNFTVLGSAGLDVELPLGPTRRVIVGVEYFNRLVTKVGGFIDGAQWYASGDGIGVRIGLGFAPGAGSGGP